MISSENTIMTGLGLSVGERTSTISFAMTQHRKGQTDTRTELLYQYLAYIH